MTNICTINKCQFFQSCKQRKNPFSKNSICQGGEKYVNQDFVPKTERTFSELKININTKNNSLEVFACEEIISKKELIIRLFFLKHKRPKEIAKIADCSLQYVYVQIKEARKKIFKGE